MKRLVIYVHGKGGSAEEAKRYQPLFAESMFLVLTINRKILGKRKASFHSFLICTARNMIPLF